MARALPALAVALLAAVAVAGPAAGVQTGGAARAPVAQGIGASSLARATPAGSTPPSTGVSLSFVLKARHLRRLQAMVEHGLRGPYLSVAQFAQTFGQTPRMIDGLVGYLSRYGIATRVQADRLDVEATGTASAVDAALGVGLEQYHVTTQAPGGAQAMAQTHVVHGTGSAPLLPASLAHHVLAVAGLTNAPTLESDVMAPAVRPVPLARGAASAPYNQKPQRFASRYRLDPLYRRGYTGAGEAVGIITFASMDPAAPERFWRTLHIPTPPGKIVVVPVDGGAGPDGSLETTLDVEQAGAIAPGATIQVYEAPDTDAGLADAWYQAVSDDTAAALSTSWSQSETYLTVAEPQDPNLGRAVDEISQALLEAAVQGQSSFAAAGDAGAYGAVPDLGTKNLAVESPSDSRFVTAVGGTTLPGTQILQGPRQSVVVRVPSERAWSWDYLWPYFRQLGRPGQTEGSYAKDNASGGGGGYSASVAMPGYQARVTGARHFRAVEELEPARLGRYGPDGRLRLPEAWTFNPTPRVVKGTARTRAVPDLSADADPDTGYEVYDAQGWNDYGGTSFVAPQFAASAAVIDQFLGRRAGFWNPWIYRLASQHGSPFVPLRHMGTTNDNLYYTGHPHTVYNAASGLGIPHLWALAKRLEAVMGR